MPSRCRKIQKLLLLFTCYFCEDQFQGFCRVQGYVLGPVVHWNLVFQAGNIGKEKASLIVRLE